MKKYRWITITATLFLTLLFLESCATTDNHASLLERGESQPALAEFRPRQVLLSLPEGGYPVFFAEVPRMANRQDEYEECYKILARQAAVWEGVMVISARLSAEMVMTLGLTENSAIKWDQERETQILEELEILSSFQDDEGTGVSALFPASMVSELEIPSNLAMVPPSWITSTPLIPGWAVAMGMAERRRYRAWSRITADLQALIELGKQIDLHAKRVVETSETGPLSGSREQTGEFSSAYIKNFTVIARWVSPDENIYYSLAICSLSGSRSLKGEK
ncbi:MAG: hypothetical protein KAU17_07805 [Spirochaetales bacterium]|nr:hypothetical protein [Spirochaetales bacterium]